jgi:hypothetical protein
MVLRIKIIIRTFAALFDSKKMFLQLKSIGDENSPDYLDI